MSSRPDRPSRHKKLWLAFWRHARSPRQWWLLLRIVGWYGLLHTLRLRLKTEELVRWAIPANPPHFAHSNAETADILRYLGWITFASSRLPGPANNCLVRALVGCRFLMQAGTTPELVIGFYGPQGHAWLELAGQPLETLAAPYRPTLRLNHNARCLEPIQQETHI